MEVPTCGAPSVDETSLPSEISPTTCESERRAKRLRLVIPVSADSYSMLRASTRAIRAIVARRR